MTILDAAEVTPGSTLRGDVCVVGAGPAGLTLARELHRVGRNVIVLEAGGRERNVDVEADTFELVHSGIAHRSDIEARGRMFGGSSSLWFGRVAVPDEIDFEHRSWVANSGWPIDRSDLAPWLDKANQLMGVDHARLLDIAAWPANPTTEAFATEPRLDLRPFLWAGQSDMGASSQAILEQSANAQVVLHATVRQLLSEEGVRVTAAEVVGPAGEFTVEAPWFVVAAGGLETPRLLLASRSFQSNGLGNQHDNVGRYYVDHPRGEGLATVPLRSLSPRQVDSLRFLDEKVPTPFGSAQFRVTFSEQHQRSNSLLNHSLHGYITTELHELPGAEGLKRLVQRARRQTVGPDASLREDVQALVQSAPGLARLAVNRARGQRPTAVELVVVDQLEQVPRRSNRVTLRAHETDRFGLPRLNVHWTVDDDTVRSHVRMHELFDEHLRSLGINGFASQVLDRPDEAPEYLDMKHPSGTTRMSESPADGVVDADCRVHGVRNLFVAGSSVFPTSGHFNPTLTIVALAARLADHLNGLLGPAAKSPH